MIKRYFDFLLGLLLLILFLPLLILIAIAVKIESPGPVFFTQKRIGKDESIFIIYKFRTMVVDTPEVATDLLNDRQKYVTRIGRILRKTSLDELPQLINILKGDMSFVGPRPALYNQYELIRMRREKGINKLVPGLTGLAQINGRDNISDHDKLKYDEEYLKQASLIFDLKIMHETFYQVAVGKNIK